jgi:hypothetical protein
VSVRSDSCLDGVSVNGLEGCANEAARLVKRTIHGLDTTDSDERVKPGSGASKSDYLKPSLQVA